MDWPEAFQYPCLYRLVRARWSIEDAASVGGPDRVSIAGTEWAAGIRAILVLGPKLAQGQRRTPSPRRHQNLLDTIYFGGSGPGLSQPRQLNPPERPLRHMFPYLGIGYELSLVRARQASPSEHTIRVHSAGGRFRLA